MPALLFSHVSKSFDNFQALTDISFEVQEGEFLALLGPNGAGKTTLINCLAGNLPRSGGQILVNGQDPEINPTYTKTQLGIVEQEITFDPFFTAMEILKLRRGLYGKSKNDEYLLWLLEKLGLSDKKDAPSMSLSGGMKRRLMIAKALAHEPSILILDEPTAGVDIELRKSLYEFLRELSKKKITIVLTTHYLEEAQLLADRISIQRKGKTLLTENKNKLLSSQNRILEIECDNGKIHEFELENNTQIDKYVKSVEKIKNIHIREPKLEDIFIKITNQK